MREKKAERLLNLFLENPDGPQTPTQRKLAISLEVLLVKELGAEGLFRGNSRMPYHDMREWHDNGGWCLIPEWNYHGALNAYGSSPPGIYELNRYGMFLWDATEFVLSLWATDLILCMRGGNDAAEASYKDLKAMGFQEVIARSESHVARFFDDPVILDSFDEHAVTDGGYYLYSVFTGRELSRETKLAVTAGADVPYLNSFLFTLLREVGIQCGESCVDKEGWLRLDDPILRKMLMLLCSAYGSMDGGDTHFSVFSSQAIGKYFSNRRNLSPGKRSIMDGLLDIVMAGRREGAFNPGGLGSAWPCCVGGFSETHGTFLSAVAYRNAMSGSPWARCASALFHLLCRVWRL